MVFAIIPRVDTGQEKSGRKSGGRSKEVGLMMSVAITAATCNMVDTVIIWLRFLFFGETFWHRLLILALIIHDHLLLLVFLFSV
ncbi:MAG: hypothetical protein OQJ98_00220 [Candidatus Pacebacteria bacterium]|nr:hypothetical protein [Candidatus Paceibacterota bacterium]